MQEPEDEETKTKMTKTKERPVYQLARLADCADPDSPDSPGGKWLRLVADCVDDAADYEVPEDAITEIADGVVPVYTHERWQVFADLAAYNEDVSEFGDYGDDLTKAAGVALYMIAERLLRALVEEVEDDEDVDEDGGA